MNEDVKRPRGRPRPQETIYRDEAILYLLKTKGPLTRNQIAAPTDEGGLNIPVTKVYLALDRLRREGKVRICAGKSGPGAVWTVGESCP